MQLSNEDLKYLRAFADEAQREGSDGWLTCDDAETRSGVTEEVRGHRARRLANLELLKQRRWGLPKFCITRPGIESISTKDPVSNEQRPASLMEQLRRHSVTFSAHAEVIRIAAARILQGGRRNDFTHSEAVCHRLSELLPDASGMGLTPVEIFILVASAYLHDIGKTEEGDTRYHGRLSAEVIMEKPELQMFFLCGDIQNQIAKTCAAHTDNADLIKGLPRDLVLDIRPNPAFVIAKKQVRPQMLAAILKMADELECVSDRTRWSEASDDDPRNSIAAVRIISEERLVIPDFLRGTPEETRNECVTRLSTKLDELEEFLAPYYLNFKAVSEEPAPPSQEEGLPDHGTPVDARDAHVAIGRIERARLEDIVRLTTLSILKGA